MKSKSSTVAVVGNNDQERRLSPRRKAAQAMDYQVLNAGFVSSDASPEKFRKKPQGKNFSILTTARCLDIFSIKCYCLVCTVWPWRAQVENYIFGAYFWYMVRRALLVPFQKV